MRAYRQLRGVGRGGGVIGSLVGEAGFGHRQASAAYPKLNQTHNRLKYDMLTISTPSAGKEYTYYTSFVHLW